jgi:hypothetical protein
LLKNATHCDGPATVFTHADGYGDCHAALLILQEQQKHRSRRITVGADKGYDTKDFIAAPRKLKVTADVTKNEEGRRSNSTAGPRGIPVTPSA